jgi:crotonobetainyl-CoA:carnitine CoA-transferase CaiB-like acyl-CoA transferase
MTDSRAGEIAVPGVVPRLSETPGEIRWLGAGLGAQNEEIYKGLLELSGAEIEDLRISGVI